MRFMTNMNDQYMNESDNEEESNYDVQDIDPGDKLVNYFNNQNNYNDDDDNGNEEEDDDNDRDMGNDDNVHGNANKRGRQLLQAVFLEEIIAGKYFNVRIVSMQKLIYIKSTNSVSS